MLSKRVPSMETYCLVASARRDAAVGATEVRYSLLYQLTHLTKDRNSLRSDDRIDALAHGVRYFRNQLARDVEKAEHYLQKLLEVLHATPEA